MVLFLGGLKAEDHRGARKQGGRLAFQIENLSRQQRKQSPFRHFLPWHRNGASNA